MRIPRPFIPVQVESKDLHHTVHVLDRDYTFGPDGLLTSVVSQGYELLAGPMRVVCMEDGENANWDENYAENESESFIQSRSEEQAVLCGAKQSDRFILDTYTSVGYDGNIDIDLKLMPRGKTVAQVFGLAQTKPIRFLLDRLWLEIPLRKEAAERYSMYPNSDLHLADGSDIAMQETTTSGKLPQQAVSMPFKALLWLGNDDRGLGWFAEREQNWQPADAERAIEVIPQEDCVILRIRLLDSQPATWNYDPAQGMTYLPVTFRFGLQATPVKPFPKQPYIHNALHLDCGIKIKGNYRDFMAAENRFDRLVEMGVTTLILHEKWNKSQNWYELSEFTAEQLTFIVTECHKRGIRVLPYFGYELSTMTRIWPEKQSALVAKDENQRTQPENAWWRVPFQRDYVLCDKVEYLDDLVRGIAHLMDTYHIDGVYLDGTIGPHYCCSLEHGCGWTDAQGKIHGTYNLKAIRKTMCEMYAAVEQRGGMINAHCYGFMNFTSLPYVHQTWYGENLQFTLVKGNQDDLDLEYYRTEYTGRNMGVPAELIVYENRPLWKFESALSSALLHGILPRPNDIGHPLELMSKVWKILGAFPVEQSQWLPYWKNQAAADHEKVRVSYYRFTALDGQAQLLAFVGNISAQPIEQVRITFPEQVSCAMDAERKTETGFTCALEPYGYRILYVR